MKADAGVFPTASASSNVRVSVAPFTVAVSVVTNAGARVSTVNVAVPASFGLVARSCATPAGIVILTSPSKSVSGVTRSV